ncbi:MAG: hypothetical protein ABEJ26_03515 [Halosimplex sp.]
MSVIQTVKSAIGIEGDETSTYECSECGSTFETERDPTSYWFSCPDCDADGPVED